MNTAPRLFATALGACLGCTPALAGPDTIYHNANVYTVDNDMPRASAFAVEDGRFMAVGSDADVLALADDDTQVIDLDGATVLPGLIDAHGHLMGLGSLATGVLDLAGTRSYHDVIEAVAARAQETRPGEWIVGRGWDHESWPSKQMPEHPLLSEAVPNHPVWLLRIDGHAGLANSEAMRLAGISDQTPTPPGGDILRNRNGAPTGVFVDNAESLVGRAIPAGIAGDPETIILAAQGMLLSAGITGVHDAGMSPDEIRLLQRMERDGTLKLRVYVMVSANHAIDWFDAHEPFSGDRVSVRAAKVYMDGAMGSRGAWLLEPYDDRPTDPDGNPYTGLAVSDLGELDLIAAHGLAHGFQVCTHAIGDRGNRETLDAYERALDLTDSRGSDHRFRVEHAQLLSPTDIPRFAQMGVIASMQPRHCTSDMRWVEDRVGPTRMLGAYAWASLLRSGAVLASGSDFPVEPYNPFLGFYAAVTRQNEEGLPAGGWLPDERLTRTEALRTFTLDAAYAAFEEDVKGSIAAGKLADFVVIDRDVMTCEPADILDTRVVGTYIAGLRVSGEPTR